MKTLEIVVDEMPENCIDCQFNLDDEYYGNGKFCFVVDGLGLIPKIGKRTDCPLIAWQSAESAPRGNTLFQLSYNGNGFIYSSIVDWGTNCKYPTGVSTPREILSGMNWLWRPLPKTPEVNP